MRAWLILRSWLSRLDLILILTLFLALVLCLHGIKWGRVESWNPDNMVYQTDFTEEGSYQPGSFQKPPFHTYLSYFLVRIPARSMSGRLGLPDHVHFSLELLMARMLTVLFFLGSLILIFLITKRSFGTFPARILTLASATSAGFVAFAHFLTADIPVTFWMLLGLFFAQRIFYDGRTLDYALAGFFTGIAAATKYNGVAAGAAIVIAHALSSKRETWKGMLLDWKLLLGALMVLIAFVLGNPYAILDTPTFIKDFMYNLNVAPIYGEVSRPHGYLKFFAEIVDLIGLPTFIASAASVIFSIYLVLVKKGDRIEGRAIAVFLSVFLLYYIYFGSFPRLPTRFVLPVVPIWLMLGAPLLASIRNRPAILIGFGGAILAYNLTCSILVGSRFNNDPRMRAQVWVQENVSVGSDFEYTAYSPIWNRLEGVSISGSEMPFISGRKRLFEDIFQDNAWVMGSVNKNEAESEEELKWYSEDSLKERGPDYIAINSLYYSRFSDNPYYPSIERYFQKLINEEYPYQVVFDAAGKEYPLWIYPSEIDFLSNRIIILKRK